jgi:hypothetical protein
MTRRAPRVAARPLRPAIDGGRSSQKTSADGALPLAMICVSLYGAAGVPPGVHLT